MKDLDITQSLKFDLRNQDAMATSDLVGINDEDYDDEIVRLEVNMLSGAAFLPVYNFEHGYYDLFCNEYVDNGKYGICKTGLRVNASKGFRAELVPYSTLMSHRLLMASSVILENPESELVIAFYQFSGFYKLRKGEICARLVLKQIEPSQVELV